MFILIYDFASEIDQVLEILKNKIRQFPNLFDSHKKRMEN